MTHGDAHGDGGVVDEQADVGRVVEEHEAVAAAWAAEAGAVGQRQRLPWGQGATEEELRFARRLRDHGDERGVKTPRNERRRAIPSHVGGDVDDHGSNVDVQRSR